MSSPPAVLLAADASPSPSPSPSGSTPAVPTLQDAQESATNAASWVEQNWSTWLAMGLQILLIVVVAVALRAVVRRAITKLIDRMNRTVQAVDGTALGGLLVNAERRRQRAAAIGSVLRSVASFLILGTAALMVLSTFQINLAPLLASAGVAGVAIGFGARNLVTDFLSGVFVILEDQYGVGDVIDAGVATGEVIEVGLRVTKAARRQRGDLVRPQRRGQADRQPVPGLGDGRRRRDRAGERGPGPGEGDAGRGRREDEQGRALERAAVGPGRGAGPGLGC